MGSRKQRPAGGGVDAINLLRADNEALKRERAALMRHIEHQRVITALMLYRLGGYVRISDVALARAAEMWDLEVGDQKELQLPAAGDADFSPTPQSALTFRLIDRATKDQLEATLKHLPQRVLDLLEAVDAELDATAGERPAADRLERAADALRKHMESSGA